MKVFFDTNVYVAQALRGDAATKAIAATHGARWRVYVNQKVLDELYRVLVEQLGLREGFAEHAQARCRHRGSIVETLTSRHTVPSDPNDSEILRSAVSAGVDYLVTNDTHLLSMHPYEGLRIISMTDYVTLLENEGLL